MNMVESIVAAAARSGVGATVIVLGGNGHLTGEIEHGGVVAAPGTVGPPAAGHDPGYAGPRLQQAQQQIEELMRALAERDSSIIEMQQAMQAGTSTATASSPEQPSETVSIDAYDIDVLGIAEDVAKKLKKTGYTTVGALRQAYLEGKLAPLKLKGGQKALIQIAERLLGKVPPERIPASGPAAGAEAGGPDGVPPGHADRSWMDRFVATKAKERDMLEFQGAIVQLQQQYPDPTAMPDEVYDKHQDLRHDFDIAKGQCDAMRWALQLDATSGTLDDALSAAGLTHLLDNPQPRVVPPA